MNPRKPQPLPYAAPDLRRRISLWGPAALLLVLVAVLVGVLLWDMRGTSTPVTPPPPAGAPAASDTWNKLRGRWVRPGEAYTIEIRSIDSTGKLDAAYFNPSPIRVSQGQLKEQDGKLSLFVELRGAGYPGSYYELNYDAAGDRMSGNYHQMATGEVYPVEFERERK